jgi:hypothetical protein
MKYKTIMNQSSGSVFNLLFVSLFIIIAAIGQVGVLVTMITTNRNSDREKNANDIIHGHVALKRLNICQIGSALLTYSYSKDYQDRNGRSNKLAIKNILARCYWYDHYF